MADIISRIEFLGSINSSKICNATQLFDKDELRRIVEFIRAGGLDKARDMEIRELERRRRALESTRTEVESARLWGNEPGLFSFGNGSGKH
jgi:hypothetical protein